MNVRSANDFPGAERKPLDYPGVRPEYSFIYYQSNIYKIPHSKIDDFLVERDNAPLSERKAVLAVGSNGCPGRLAEKYANHPEVAIPVFVGTMVNTAVVYSRQFAPYGVLPATYMYQPGAISNLSVVMLTEEQLTLMNKTEKVGKVYSLEDVPGYFRVNKGPMIGDLKSYLDRKILTFRGKPVRLEKFAGKDNLDWRKMNESDLLSLVFNQAGKLKNKTIEERHQQLLVDETLKAQLDKYINTSMSGMDLDELGQLIEKKRPSVTCSHVLPTSTRPHSKGTYIVRLTQAISRELKAKNKEYLRVRYGNNAVIARLSVDDEIKNNQTICMDQTIRTAIGLAPMMQGVNTDKTELFYRPGKKSDLMYPIDVQRAKFKKPNFLTRMLGQQYLICIAHNAMAADMETQLVRLTEQAMQILGIKPGDRVRLINGERVIKLRCLPLDPKYQLPLKAMDKDFADWKYPIPDEKELRLPWIALDRQARLALDVQPWQPIVVGRDTGQALRSELGEVAYAVALATLGGAIVVKDPVAQAIILAAGFLTISVLICMKIRSRI